jgi:hypothetical protein
MAEPSEQQELRRDTLIAWRAFAGTAAFTDGVRFLREKTAPSVAGKSAVVLLELSLKWGGYQQALNDLTEVLCFIEKPKDSLEEPPLRT